MDFTQKILRLFSHLATHHSFQVALGFAFLAILSAYLSVNYLRLNTNQDDLISNHFDYAKNYANYRKEFGDKEKIYIVIETKQNVELATEAAEKIRKALIQRNELILSAYYKVPDEAFSDNFLLLPQMSIRDVRAFGKFASRLNRLDPLIAKTKTLADLLKHTSEFGGKDGKQAHQLNRSLIKDIERALDRKPLLGFKKSLSDLYRPSQSLLLLSEDRNFLFLEVLPKKNFESLEVISKPLLFIREVIEAEKKKYPDLSFGLTGRPVLQADEMRTTDSDMTRATVLAIVLVFLVFVVFFRRLKRPFLALVSLCISILITFGFVSVSIGYLTILSVVFAAMLVGLGVDFAIHFLARYQDYLNTSHDVEESIESALVEGGRGIWAGGLTTAIAFFSVTFVEFKGLAELGLIAGAGIIICLVTMLLFFPALIYLSDRKGVSDRLPLPIRVPGIEQVTQYPRSTFLGIVLITFLSLIHFDLPTFNYNLLELQAQDLESVIYERKISQSSDRGSWFAVLVAKTLEEVDSLLAKVSPLQEDGIVGAIDSPRDFIAIDQDKKIKLLSRFADNFVPIKRVTPSEDVDVSKLSSAIRESLSSSELINRLSKTTSDQHNDLKKLQRLWMSELDEFLQSIPKLLRPKKIEASDVPKVIRDRFQGSTGKYLVAIYPQIDIWNEDEIETFVGSLRKIDPNVTGSPVTVYESALLMKKGFLQAGILSLVIVFFLLLIEFRKVHFALLAMIPVGAAIVWLSQLMPALGLSLNLANFFAFPILIGCGVDGGVHFVHRFRQSSSVKTTLKTTGSAIVLSFLTTMIGFGSLSIASHQGIASLGLLMLIGMLCILVATVVLLPALAMGLQKQNLLQE